MNKEELIGKLKMVYVGDKNALNELIGYYDGLKECIEIVQQENKQLKANWNKLRKWIVYNKHNENTKQRYLVVDYGTLLGKMQELEQGSDK